MPAFETNSPLRYPGGKAVLARFLGATVDANDLKGCNYVEPFAGGAGAALNLLIEGKVGRITLNDFDRGVWSFWQAVLFHADELVDLIGRTEVTVEEWRRQREIYRQQSHRTVDLGFAAFFLNRCNRSGIIGNGSVIGGLDQTGKWKINARYNPVELIRRIRQIALLRESITVFHLDAVEFLKQKILVQDPSEKLFIYLDPPYFEKGSRLYMNSYGQPDHAQLASFLRGVPNIHWLVTYDNAPQIRELYSWRPIIDFDLHYSAASSKIGKEIMIPSPTLELPVEHLSRAIWKLHGGSLKGREQPALL